jgi:uncharacterized protein YcaQ
MVSAMSKPVIAEVSVADARRMALAGQGLASARPERVQAGRMQGLIERVGVLQLDSVNAVCRSHYLPVFARLGSYPRTTLDAMAWGTQGRALFEYWGHKASLLPLSLYPFMRWRMESAREWDWTTWSMRGEPGSPTGGSIPPDWSRRLHPSLRAAPWAVISGMTRIGTQRPGFVDEVMAAVGSRGALTAREFSETGRRGGSTDVGTGTMWNWQDAKIALEWLFYMGQVTTASRRGFERVYDLTERAIPESVLAKPAPERGEAQRHLLRLAAAALGIATERQLRGYFQLPADQVKPLLEDLVESGELVPMRIEGVRQRTYAPSDAPAPEPSNARALLSPFDSLIWDRDRTERLFGFHYRIAIYTRASERVHGYWVMPFLLGENLVARVDLKAERNESALTVPAANAEAGFAPRDIAGPLAAELRLMAEWLGLERVVVRPVGDLAPALTQAVGRDR